MMKKTLAALLFALGAAALPASASVLEYEFTGTINTLFSWANFDFGAPNHPGAIAGTTIANGDAILGHFSYDNATPNIAAPNDGPDHAAFFGPNLNNQAHYTVLSNGQTSTIADLGKLSLENYRPDPNGPDVLAIFSVSDPNTANFMSLTSSYGHQWDAMALPAALDLNVLKNGYIMTNYFSADGDKIALFASIDSVRAINAVPEPGTYVLLLTGLLLAGATRLRRR